MAAQVDHLTVSWVVNQSQIADQGDDTKPGNGVLNPDDTSKAGKPELEQGGDDSFLVPVGELPDWISRGSFVDDDSLSEYLVVSSKPRFEQTEAEKELDRRLLSEVHDKVDSLFAPGAGDAIGLDLAFVKQNLLTENGVHVQVLLSRVPEALREMVSSESQKSYQYYAHVCLDQEFNEWASHKWEERLVLSRTLQAGLIALSSILVLSILFGYCTVNHKTRGFYSGRLQTCAWLSLLAILVAAAVLSEQFPWL